MCPMCNEKYSKQASEANDAKIVGTSSLSDVPLNRKNPVVQICACVMISTKKTFLQLNDENHSDFGDCDGTMPILWKAFWTCTNNFIVSTMVEKFKFQLNGHEAIDWYYKTTFLIENFE